MSLSMAISSRSHCACSRQVIFCVGCCGPSTYSPGLISIDFKDVNIRVSDSAVPCRVLAIKTSAQNSRRGPLKDSVHIGR
jgi:hypothetical protein